MTETDIESDLYHRKNLTFIQLGRFLKIRIISIDTHNGLKSEKLVHFLGKPSKAKMNFF